MGKAIFSMAVLPGSQLTTTIQAPVRVNAAYPCTARIKT